ncbi:hypothetical protein [Streptomyces sp. CAI-85]|uniref:hypothetical protein n=1 Tax=Streptomyces sp. CAI-85 TaxID=1472662 RepID=UPI0015870FD1|nr:hypothetical protein [Streptomyces sp. CAI-85]NUV62624.1 hypothetical protein [Streptomyces sp. CAI-85]
MTLEQADTGDGIDRLYRGGQLMRLTSRAQELLAQLTPTTAMRLWMDLVADSTTTKHGPPDRLLAMIASRESTHAQSRTEPLTAITTNLDAGQASGDLCSDVTPKTWLPPSSASSRLVRTGLAPRSFPA